MHLGCLIDAPPHAVTPCSRRDLASNLGEAAFVLSDISLSGSESDLFEPTETLKGMDLRPYPGRGFCCKVRFPQSFATIRTSKFNALYVAYTIQRQTLQQNH